MRYIEAFFTLTGFIVWVLLIFGLVTGLFQRLRQRKDENDRIYQKRSESLRSKENENLDGYTWVEELNEGEETELTFKDLQDSDDNIFHSHMNF